MATTTGVLYTIVATLTSSEPSFRQRNNAFRDVLVERIGVRGHTTGTLEEYKRPRGPLILRLLIHDRYKMFKLIVCALFVAAAFGKPLDDNLSKRESIGHQLKEQLKNVAVSSLTTSVSGVLDKALGALTSKAIGGITNLLGHIHLGKRGIFGDFLHGDLVKNVENFIHKEKELLNELLHHHQTRNILGDFLHGDLVKNVENFIHKEKELLNELLHHHQTRSIFGDLLKTDIVQNVKDFIHKEKELLNELLHHHQTKRNILGDLFSGELVKNVENFIHKEQELLGQFLHHKQTRNIFGDILKTDIVQNVKDFIHKEKELLNELLHHHQTTRSTGSELREALKGALVSSATGAINTVVNTAISGLTSALTSGLTNVLGHIHLGKRDLAFAKDIAEFEHNLKNDLFGKVHSLIEKEKQHIIDEVLHHHHIARRNIFGDIGKMIGGELKHIGEGALGSLGQLATSKLDGLISKLGRREAEDLSTVFGGVADKFSTAITDALGELPQIIAQELGPLIAQFTGSQ
ncbi:hypothetical protein LOTGIDRAFT_237132 [Lottia gigantea]|uniref:Uncharacterized protein n=1 Tax=Lottia gigantea TaxID=225164 RepID=V3ZIJ7_LOTGI|nr:hypothetical protein LOTGIDRAFT_237132 [Lottia gigantea]ESO82145.1 hypothetical protein LOTGIDRAFT_237132 [Lottia gigantea]